MSLSLFLIFLCLALATAATHRSGDQCPACGGPALDLENQRDLLLNLAKRSILNKLHLSQRPVLRRPVSRAALRTALQRLQESLWHAPLEDSRAQEYEIISFAETGGFPVCNSSPESHPFRKGYTTSATCVLIPAPKPWDSGLPPSLQSSHRFSPSSSSSSSCLTNEQWGIGELCFY